MDIRLKKCSANDLGSVFKFICTLESEDLDISAFSKKFINHLNREDIFYFMIQNEKCSIGFISIHLQHVLHHNEPVAEIQEFFISEEWRNMGYGKMVINQIKEIITEMGLCQIELSTNKKRTAAFEFYKSCCFKDTHHKLTMII